MEANRWRTIPGPLLHCCAGLIESLACWVGWKEALVQRTDRKRVIARRDAAGTYGKLGRLRARIRLSRGAFGKASRRTAPGRREKVENHGEQLRPLEGGVGFGENRFHRSKQ